MVLKSTNTANTRGRTSAARFKSDQCGIEIFKGTGEMFLKESFKSG